MDSDKDGPAARIDRASRTILATPRTLFRAFIDPEILTNWRAPEGMTASIGAFDARVGGGYEMVLRYTGPDAASHGMSAPGEDQVQVRFVQLIAEELIEEEVLLLSDDPAFFRPMTLMTRFQPVKGGTKVTFEASHVPGPIVAQDHALGMEASLRRLALVTE